MTSKPQHPRMAALDNGPTEGANRAEAQASSDQHTASLLQRLEVVGAPVSKVYHRRSVTVGEGTTDAEIEAERENHQESVFRAARWHFRGKRGQEVERIVGELTCIGAMPCLPMWFTRDVEDAIHANDVEPLTNEQGRGFTAPRED